MSARPSILRSAALLCAAHARRVQLRRSQFWADGMEQEAHHIDDDWSALQWALGCVFASYAEVLKAERFFIPVLARLCLAAITLFYAQQPLSGLISTLECHLYDLPHGVPDPVAVTFVYRHFFFAHVTLPGYSCFRAYSLPWMPAIQAGIGGLYLAAGLRVVQGRASAVPLFFAAVVASPPANALATVLMNGWPYEYWYSVLWHVSMVDMAWVTCWRLIVCVCIGLFISLDNKRKIAR